MIEDIPQWALTGACDLLNAEPSKPGDFTWTPEMICPGGSASCFARYIQTTSDIITRACRMIEEGNEGDAVAELGTLILEPVDPLLIEAREIAASCERDSRYTQRWAEKIRAGKHDDSPAVEMILNALRRGIELGKAQS